MLKNNLTAFFLILIALGSAQAQNLQSVIYDKDNILILSFDDSSVVDPEMFTTKLSDDKTSLSLDLAGVDYDNSRDNISRVGKINGIYFTDNDSRLKLDIKFNDSYGYTCTPQPLSASLVISVFKWNELDPGEDHYRSAQLALESGLIGEAKSSLVDAIDNGSKEGELLLAFMKAQEEGYDSASLVENFKTKNPIHTSLPDVVFKAGEVLSFNGEDEAAIVWLERYEELTGSDDMSGGSPTTIIEYLVQAPEEEGNNEKEKSEVSTLDTAEAAISKNKTIEDFGVLLAVSLSCIAVCTLGLVFMQKKRKEKLTLLASQDPKPVISDEDDIDFDKQLENAKLKRQRELYKGQNKNPVEMISHIANNHVHKKDSSSNLLNKVIDGKDQTNDAYSTDEEIIEEETGNKNVSVKSEKRDIESFLATFIPEKRAAETESQGLENTIRDVVRQVELDNSYNPNSQQSAEMELALRIAEKENNSRQSKLRQLDLSKMENNSRLDKLSKQLNIDTSALSAKKRVYDLHSDKRKLSKLSQRFDVN
jgi:hypothetical protein